MTELLLYCFSPTTGEFIGISKADADPETPGEWLIPAFSTQTAPPVIPEKQAAIFRDEAWALLPDHRGEVWYEASGARHPIVSLGDPSQFPVPLLPQEPEPAEPLKSLGDSIRDWQFFTALALQSVITPAEALATSAGDLPHILSDALATIPDPNSRLVATMKVRNTTDFYRNDDMVAFVAAYLTKLGTFGVWDDARLDALWVSAAKLA